MKVWFNRVFIIFALSLCLPVLAYAAEVCDQCVALERDACFKFCHPLKGVEKAVCATDCGKERCSRQCTGTFAPTTQFKVLRPNKATPFEDPLAECKQCLDTQSLACSDSCPAAPSSHNLLCRADCAINRCESRCAPGQYLRGRLVDDADTDNMSVWQPPAKMLDKKRLGGRALNRRR